MPMFEMLHRHLPGERKEATRAWIASSALKCFFDMFENREWD